MRLDYLKNPYWTKHFDGIRRVAPPAPTPFDAPTYISPAPAPSVVPTPSADAFEPPPATMTAAQRQSQAVAPQNADAFEPPPSSLTATQRQARAAGATAPTIATINV